MLSATRAAEPPFQLDQADSAADINELLTDAHAEALVGLLDEPVSARLKIYAYFLGSDEERTDALLGSAAQIPEALYPICLVLRYLVLKEHSRLGESSRRFNWSLKQIHAAVASAYHAHIIHSALAADPQMTTLPSRLAYPDALGVEPTTRDIHLQSSVQLTLLAAWQLAQSLLLCPVPFSAPPSALCLGSLFHTIAQTPDPATREGIAAVSTPIENAMLDWILHDTEQLLAIDVEALRKAKRERKKEEKKQQVAVAEAEKKKAAAAAKQTTARSGFSLLSLDNDDQVDDDDSDEE